MTILFFAGALRAESSNKKLAREACRLAGLSGIKGEFIDLKDYPLPVYDGDIEAAGLPENVAKLGQKIRLASALVISTPEYNGAISGMLKNVVDWLSREKEMSLGGKHLMLLSASPGAMGGIRGLWHARQPFEALGMHVYPNMVGVPGAYGAFDDKGQIKDPALVEKLQKAVTQFAEHAG